MIIRPYKDRDYDLVRKLWQRTGLFEEVYDSKENFRKKIKKDPQSVLVIADEKRIIAAVYFICDPVVTTIWHLAVDPDEQRRGVAGILINRVKEILRRRKQKMALLIVEQDNIPAVKLYEKCGWKTYIKGGSPAKLQVMEIETT